MASPLDMFVAGLTDKKTGAVATTVAALKENQFGIPLKHFAQQYLFGATGLRIQVFNSIQGEKEVGKSTLMFDIMGDICGAEEDGGLGGIAVLYELEGKISPTILASILRGHGERALQACIPRLGMTLEEALDDFNTKVLPMYLKAFPKLDRPLIIGLDSIGGSASEDTIGKLEKEGVAGKGYYNKQHFMKYFCENEGPILARSGVPVVIMCINQEREGTAAPGFAGPPPKVITGGRAQLFKDGHMISAKKKALGSGDGNIITLKTTKTSFCDAREIKVEFRWNKYGVKEDDAYEARFLWGLASAQCLAEPTKGVGEIRDICDVKVSDQQLVTCPQLGLKSVQPDEFEAALMADAKLLGQLYTYMKIDRLKDLTQYADWWASKGKPKKEEPEEKPKAKSKAKAKPAPTSLDELTPETPDA